MKRWAVAALLLVIALSLPTSPLLAKRKGTPPVSGWEFKMLLKPTNFEQQAAGTKAWLGILAKACRQAGISMNPVTQHIEEVRFIEFLDTPQWLVRKQGLVLRCRQKAEPGTLSGKLRLEKKLECTLKSRNGDAAAALAWDVRAAKDLKSKTKFEENFILGPSAINLVYDYSCSTDIKPPFQPSVAQMSAVFPLLGQLGIPVATAIKPVNGLRIREHSQDVAEFRMSGGPVVAELIFWFKDGATNPLIVEFAFKVRSADVLPTAKKLLQALQQEASAWLHLGSSKTSIVYEQTPGTR